MKPYRLIWIQCFRSIRQPPASLEKLRGRMPRLPAEKHIAADPARTGIVEPVPNTAVIFEIRNLGVIPISIMEDRRLDIQTFDLTSGCRQSHERNDAYFAQTQSQYTAAFLPEYPEKSKRDSTISCCWLNGG